MIYLTLCSSAERALDTLNYTCIKGYPCRIMWSQRDPTVRKSNSGNLFVKNLDKGVDNRALHDTFSLFGNILSCKVVTDDSGKSKGYGFVHFESDEPAMTAVERVNGMKIGAKEVFVGPFHKRAEHPCGKVDNFTNLYLRDFPSSWREKQIEQVFSEFGTVTSTWLSADKLARPFACVNYSDVAAAKAAVEALNGRKVNAAGLLSVDAVAAEAVREAASESAGPNAAEPKATDSDEVDQVKQIFSLFVDRAQDKAERTSTIKAKFDSKAPSFRSKYDGVNLYIKNLSDTVSEMHLLIVLHECMSEHHMCAYIYV